MGHPNEPRRMTPRGDGARAPEFDTHVSGNAGRDGFTRVACRKPPGHPDDSPFGFGGPWGGSDAIDPPVGERDYRRGPRFSEDY